MALIHADIKMSKYIKYTWEHSLVLQLNGMKIAVSLLLISFVVQNRECIWKLYCGWSLIFDSVLLSHTPKLSGRMLVSLSPARSLLTIRWYSWSSSSSHWHCLILRYFVIWRKHWLTCNVKISPTLLFFFAVAWSQIVREDRWSLQCSWAAPALLYTLIGEPEYRLPIRIMLCVLTLPGGRRNCQAYDCLGVISVLLSENCQTQLFLCTGMFK